MLKLLGIMAICFCAFIQGYSQTNRNQPLGKPSEQKEINVDSRLEKELKQKQLYAKPEMLAEPPVRDTVILKGLEKVSRKRKSGRHKAVKKI